MKFVLDFDDCIFDTKLLKQILEDCGIDESARSAELFNQIREHPEYNSFEVSDLVFPDALQFIEDYGEHCIIVSSASSIKDDNNLDSEMALEFQRAKINLSGVSDLVLDVVVVEESKTEALYEVQKEYGTIIFFDDRQKYIREATELGIEALRINRSGGRASESIEKGMITDFTPLGEMATQKGLEARETAA